MSAPARARKVPGSSSPFIAFPCTAARATSPPAALGSAAPLCRLSLTCGVRRRGPSLRRAVALRPVRRVPRMTPTHDRLERHAPGRDPVMLVVAVPSVAVRPTALVDGDAANTVTGAHREVLGALAWPRDDFAQHRPHHPA